MRGEHGEHTDPGAGGIYDLSNKVRFGIDETEAVLQMYKGVQKVIQAEVALGGTATA